MIKLSSALIAALLGSALMSSPVLAVDAQKPAVKSTALGKPTSKPQGVRSSPKQAADMLDRATDYIAKRGNEKAFAAFNNQAGRFVSNDLYVTVVGIDGIMHADGAEPEGLVGLNTMDLADASGKPFVKEMIETAVAKNEGKVEYLWLNRATNRVEMKTALFRLVGNNVVSVGYYTPRSTAEQARALLEMAVKEMGAVGTRKAFSEFNDPKSDFVRDDLYVFAVGLNDGKFYAMGASPSRVGADATKLRDAAGKPIIQEMITAAKTGTAEVYDYVWRNPATNKVEPKHSYIQKVDQYVVGVGYYGNAVTR